MNKVQFASEALKKRILCHNICIGSGPKLKIYN